MAPRSVRFLVLAFVGLCPAAPARGALSTGEVHVWETQEIVLRATGSYANPYADVECWVELEGPGFARRVHGFWDGGRSFRVRFVATAPGASSPKEDALLASQNILLAAHAMGLGTCLIGFAVGGTTNLCCL